MIVKGPVNEQKPARPQNPRRSDNFKRMIDNGAIEEYSSQLSINRPFGTNEFAQRFCVCNPRKATNGDYIVYSVYGEDQHGRYEIQRRYNEFFLLRQVLY